MCHFDPSEEGGRELNQFSSIRGPEVLKKNTKNVIIYSAYRNFCTIRCTRL